MLKIKQKQIHRKITRRGRKLGRRLLCPFIYITAKGQQAKDQGAGKFFAAKFVDGKDATAEDKIGFVIDFSKEPGEILKTKLGVKISGNKYYIPYRLDSSLINLNTKTLLGTNF